MPKDLSIFWIPKLIAVLACTIPNEDAPLGLRIQLVLWSRSTWTNEIESKVCRLSRFTSLPVHASSGIPQFRTTDGPLLIRYTSVLTAFAQYCLDNLVYIRMFLAYSRIVLFMCSTTLFWWGFPRNIFTLRIFWSRLHSTDFRFAQDSSNLPSQYSPHCQTSSTWAFDLIHSQLGPTIS